MQKIYELVIGRNSDIREEISSFIINKGWKNVYICGAIGSAKNLIFTNPISDALPPVTGTTEIEGPAEILNFTGEVMEMDKIDAQLKAIYKDSTSPLFIHIHASCAIKDAIVYGGGLKSGKVFRALKIYLIPM